MTQEKLLLMLKSRRFSPTILNTADATHYLVGAEDNKGNFYHLKNEQHQSLLTRSLDEAKCHLKSLGLSHAIFEMISPYDEMIGSADENNCKTRLDIYF